MSWQIACRGLLPATLAQLSNLQWMLLDNNQLTGSLPASWARCPASSGCCCTTTALQDQCQAAGVQATQHLMCQTIKSFVVSACRWFWTVQVQVQQGGLCRVVTWYAHVVSNCTNLTNSMASAHVLPLMNSVVQHGSPCIWCARRITAQMCE